MNLLSTINSKTSLLFDLFHTLTSLESTGQGGPMTHAMLGVSLEDWNRQLLECSNARLIGEMTEPFEIMRSMAHAIDPAIPEALIAQVTETRIKRFAGALTNIPAATVNVLQALRDAGKKIALVSNADVTEIQAWDNSPIADLFDAVIFSCQVGHAKPAPEIYQLAMMQLSSHAGETLFIGDGGSNELQGARDCGLTTVMFTGLIRPLWPDKINPRRAQADFVIEELSELIQ